MQYNMNVCFISSVVYIDCISTFCSFILDMIIVCAKIRSWPKFGFPRDKGIVKFGVYPRVRWTLPEQLPRQLTHVRVGSHFDLQVPGGQPLHVVLGEEGAQESLEVGLLHAPVDATEGAQLAALSYLRSNDVRVGYE